MKIPQKICFVLLLTTFSSVYGGSCFDGNNFDFETCKREAEQGHSDAQYNLGWMYNEGKGVIQDYKESVKWYTKAAEQGLAEAQYNLGYMYANEQGVIQDYKEAAKWWKKSAEQGYSKSQFSLGLMYVQTKGVIQDFVMAHMYFNIAAVSGYKDAIKNRGIVEQLMTLSQIAEAQRMAREWMRTHE